MRWIVDWVRGPDSIAEYDKSVVTTYVKWKCSIVALLGEPDPHISVLWASCHTSAFFRSSGCAAFRRRGASAPRRRTAAFPAPYRPLSCLSPGSPFARLFLCHGATPDAESKKSPQTRGHASGAAAAQSI
jgi:hypothetical protein